MTGKPSRVIAVLLAVGAAGLGACGDSGSEAADKEAVKTVVERFTTAFAKNDSGEICNRLLADELRRSVESVGLTCEQAISESAKSVKNPKLEVLGVSVRGDLGYATVRSTATGQEPSVDRIALTRSDDEWRITALNTENELSEDEQPEVSEPVPLTTPKTTTAR